MRPFWLLGLACVSLAASAQEFQSGKMYVGFRYECDRSLGRVWRDGAKEERIKGTFWATDLPQQGRVYITAAHNLGIGIEPRDVAECASKASPARTRAFLGSLAEEVNVE